MAQDKRREKYEREALAEGVAVRHPVHGVILKSLATRLDAVWAGSMRERCGVLGKPRTERARMRVTHRAAVARGVRTHGFRQYALYMGVSV